MAERRTSRQPEPQGRVAVIRDRVTEATRTTYHRTTAFIKRRPMTSFLLLLGLLLIVLILGKFLEKGPEEKAEQNVTKDVQVYSIGQGPQATFQAKVEKSGVVKIMAQSAGVVQQISVTEGKTVSKGQTLITLSTNYQGGNAPAVQTEIAQTQYQNVLDTFGLQTDAINLQRSVATASAAQAQQNRDIAKKSLDDTNNLINTNQAQLDSINQQLTLLRATDPTNPQIAELESGANQLQASLAQLRGQQRTTEYTSANDKEPALLATLQKDLTLKQLEVQEKGLTLNKQVSGLQVDLAAVSEALMYPATPIAGTVERINVRKGQLVSPGSELATVVAAESKTTSILLVPQAIARTMYASESSTLVINNKQINVVPTHIATEATDGQLYAVTYEIPTDQAAYLTDGEYIQVMVPIGAMPSTPSDPLIPIDAVYQNQENAYVLVVKNNKAETKTVTAGNVYGSYVEVASGLQNGDKIILNRNVVAGDTVKIN